MSLRKIIGIFAALSAAAAAIWMLLLMLNLPVTCPIFGYTLSHVDSVRIAGKIVVLGFMVAGIAFLNDKSN